VWADPVISLDDTALVARMVEISENFEAYGYRRLAALRHQGLVNHKKLLRLMREQDLQPRRRRRYVAPTDSDHDQYAAERYRQALDHGLVGSMGRRGNPDDNAKAPRA